jgi:hypothetical protein
LAIVFILIQRKKYQIKYQTKWNPLQTKKFPNNSFKRISQSFRRWRQLHVLCFELIFLCHEWHRRQQRLKNFHTQGSLLFETLANSMKSTFLTIRSVVLQLNGCGMDESG